MNTSIQINFNGQLVRVEEVSSPDCNEKLFVAHLPGGDLDLCMKEDTEGDGRWIDKKVDHETAESGEIGALIETALAGQKSSL